MYWKTGTNVLENWNEYTGKASASSVQLDLKSLVHHPSNITALYVVEGFKGGSSIGLQLWREVWAFPTPNVVFSWLISRYPVRNRIGHFGTFAVNFNHSLVISTLYACTSISIILCINIYIYIYIYIKLFRDRCSIRNSAWRGNQIVYNFYMCQYYLSICYEPQ